MRAVLTLGASLFVLGAAAEAQKPPLLPEKDVAALANELSGETAKRNLEGIARFHRQRGSQGFHSAAELVAERARAYGLSDAAILQFPADGKIFYGTQRSRPAWDAQEGELWEVKNSCEWRVTSGEQEEKSRSLPIRLGTRAPRRALVAALGMTQGGMSSGEKKIASYEAEPIVLAEDSESADVTADLVDVGGGTKEGDYARKDGKGTT